VVMGKLLQPGRSVMVDEDALKRAHKLKKDVAAGIAYVGKTPPKEYLARKNPPRAKLEPGVSRTHGVILPKEAEVAVNAGAKKLDLIDTVHITDSVSVELKPAPVVEKIEELMPEEPEESWSTEEDKDSRKKKRGR
jgi:hypothetical protein